MREDDARRLLLVRAVETEDRAQQLLTAEDRAQAEDYARRTDNADPQSYLARRAEFAATRLATRHPHVDTILKARHWPRWLSFAIPIAALVLGALSNELGNDKRLDLLAFPLVGVFAWNLAVYAILLVQPIWRRASGRPGGEWWRRPLAKLSEFGRDQAERGTPMARATGRFATHWLKASAPVNGARAARTLHLGAALFAVGIIAGIFVRALAIEYRAGWESTFLQADDVRALLGTLLGPASALGGIPLPDVAGYEALRWTGPRTGGVNAGPWISLYAISALIFIVIPRLALAAWEQARVWRRARKIAVPGREDFYIRRLMRARDGTGGAVRVTPYGYTLEEPRKAALTTLLRDVLGDRARIHFDAVVPYGQEEQWLADHALAGDDDYHIALYTLSATPEDENHGTFAAGLRRKYADIGHGTMASALVDTGPFRSHFAGQAGLAERVGERLRAWEAVMERAAVPLVNLDLDHVEERRDGEKMEATLVRSAALEGLA